MSKQQFKVGDEVVVTSAPDYADEEQARAIIGQKGVIDFIDDGGRFEIYIPFGKGLPEYFDPENLSALTRASEAETVEEETNYIVVNITTAQPIDERIYSKSEAESICRKNWLGTYHATNVFDHIKSLLSWYKPGEQEFRDEQTTAHISALQKEVEELRLLLPKAFQAGEEWANECNCGECDYCQTKSESAPKFDRWLQQVNPPKH